MDSVSSTSPVTTTTTAQADTSHETEHETDTLSDYDTFLELLMVQLENQDPTDPMDTNELSAQLATFSTVEQQVETNELLEEINANITAQGMSDLASWVGMEARADMPVDYHGQPIEFRIDPPSTASNVDLVIHDEAGTEMARIATGVTYDPLTWTGLDQNGNELPYGTYSMTMVAYSGDEVIAEEGAEIYAVVDEARQEGSETILTFAGGIDLPAEEVESVRAPRIYETAEE